MTRLEAIREFNETIRLEVIRQYGKTDKPAMRQAWNDWTDALCKDGRITQRQYDRWLGPVK